MSHNSKSAKPKTIEEKIVSSADGASKILYAQIFGLLSKKQPQEKPEWILKHIEKGYKIICLPEFKKITKAQYNKNKKFYLEIIKEKNKFNIVI